MKNNSQAKISNKLFIFDTTLRDGEQSPGASMTKEGKLQIAKQLERLKVDVIEAGFAAASEGDFQAVSAIAETIKESTICSLSRASENDIKRAAEALSKGKRSRIHTFIATSQLHMEKKLGMTPDQVLDRATNAVRFARDLLLNSPYATSKEIAEVQFSAEDASRSDEDFLCRIIEAVIKAGATIINIPDTVGYGIPAQYGQLIKNCRERIPNSDKAIWSVHCHNDLGLGVANSLAGIEIGGARQVECTINGLGERAGNTALEEIVMALRTRHAYFGIDVGIDVTQIVPASKLVSQTTGFMVQPNKAIVGANAFAHTSGIHQDGVLKARDTYEIMRAQDVGWTANKIVLGKLSGRNAFKERLKTLNIDCENELHFNSAFESFKALADKKTDIYDEDIFALMSNLVSDEIPHSDENNFNFISLSQSSSSSSIESKSISKIVFCRGCAKDKSIISNESTGNGPVDATFNAIEEKVKSGAELVLYSVNAITNGTQAHGEVTVRLSKGNKLVNGIGTDLDIIAASAKAYLAALSQLESQIQKIDPQK